MLRQFVIVRYNQSTTLIPAEVGKIAPRRIVLAEPTQEAPQAITGRVMQDGTFARNGGVSLA